MFDTQLVPPRSWRLGEAVSEGVRLREGQRRGEAEVESRDDLPLRDSVTLAGFVSPGPVSPLKQGSSAINRVV